MQKFRVLSRRCIGIEKKRLNAQMPINILKAPRSPDKKHVVQYFSNFFPNTFILTAYSVQVPKRKKIGKH